jgi:hypothetical protein
MSQRLETDRGYHVADYSLDETPARFISPTLWPKRDCINSSVSYCEWFDWSELFAEGAPEKLLSISRGFSSSAIRIGCMLTDASVELPQSLKVVEIDRESLAACYFEAIWDKRNISSPIAAAARIVIVWDSTEKWIVVNDRFFEMGVFAILDSEGADRTTRIFDCLDEQELLDRFSRILRVNKVAAFSEVRRWAPRELR